MPESIPETPPQRSEDPSPVSPEPRRPLGFRRSLVRLVPTVNAVLVVIQTTVMDPTFDQAFSPWVYVIANAAVVLGAAAMKILWIVGDGDAQAGLGTDTSNR